jgi:transcriptional regulator with XRE-family HTH domain
LSDGSVPAQAKGKASFCEQKEAKNFVMPKVFAPLFSKSGRFSLSEKPAWRTALGFPAERRRMPGLRREEVAQRANISPTWYTWLEQGRRGALSADVLERIARALGAFAFEYSTFAIDGRTDLSMTVYNPATPADAERIKFLIERANIHGMVKETSLKET